MTNKAVFESCLMFGTRGRSVQVEMVMNSSFPLFPINGTLGLGGDEHDFIRNLTMGLDHSTLTTQSTETVTDRMDMLSGNNRFETARSILKIFHPMICVFGLLGNILTLLILTRKRLKMSCDGTERTVHIGLTALAVSDFLFCLTLLPYGLLKDSPFSFPSKSFHLIYEIYSPAFINTFILTSTWLTVTMATSRYLAICHPFRARHVIGITGTKTSILLVFIVSFVFNIPRLLHSQIDSLECHNGKRMYFKGSGYIHTGSRADVIYIWIYFTIAILLPLATLAFCNICLVKALRESVKIRRRYRVPAAHVDSNYRITSILVTIVVMYIALVSPAEMLQFIRDLLSKDSAPALVLAVEITNLLQMINFSCNFVLYFVLNVHFRRGMRDMFCECSRVCVKRKQDPAAKLPLNRQVSLRTTQTLV